MFGKVYVGKDGRSRIVFVGENGKHSSMSYPRYLLEQKLGRKLLSTEDVHHIDGDKTNNSLDNLEVVNHKKHAQYHGKLRQKYVDTKAICDVCGKEFLWTAKRQSRYYIDCNRGRLRIISCSWECSSRYGRWKQLGRV